MTSVESTVRFLRVVKFIYIFSFWLNMRSQLIITSLYFIRWNQPRFSLGLCHSGFDRFVPLLCCDQLAPCWPQNALQTKELKRTKIGFYYYYYYFFTEDHCQNLKTFFAYKPFKNEETMFQFHRLYKIFTRKKKKKKKKHVYDWFIPRFCIFIRTHHQSKCS